MANFYIFIIEESIKAYSIIGHGQDCKFEFVEKGQKDELSLLNDGDKLIGYISNNVKKFSYVFDIMKADDSNVHIIKSFETSNGPSIEEVDIEIKNEIFTNEQTKSFIQIDENSFNILVSLMTKSAAKNVIDVNNLYRVKDTEYKKNEYSIEELGSILKNMYDNAAPKTQVPSIHIFGIKYGKNIVEKGYKASEIIKAANMDDTRYDAELSKSIGVYKCLAAQTYGISILDEQGLIAKPEPQGMRVTGAENILLYGVPGSGKSNHIKKYYEDQGFYTERVVFHPDYTYSDFVGQILPRVKGEKLQYEFTAGPFTKILKEAYYNPDNRYCLIIEEINRGNAPAIFGEIFQLLDRKNEFEDQDKIGESKYGITNFDIARDVYGDENREIIFPSNLWIISTMNTSDQNVFTLDTAFQRRWRMEHIENNILNAKHAKYDISGTNIVWGAFATVINDILIDESADMSSSEDKRLGAYFVLPKELESDRFAEKVLKYLWDDAFKMNRNAVFDEKLKSLEQVINEYKNTKTDKLKTILRSNVYEKMKNTTEELK